jgi:hypothetical protein
MSTINTLEREAIREKLLQILRDNNLLKIIKITELLIESSEKIGDIMEKINAILEDNAIDKRVYHPNEWAAAYIIAHEYYTLKRLENASWCFREDVMAF